MNNMNERLTLFLIN